MGLFGLLRRLFFGTPGSAENRQHGEGSADPVLDERHRAEGVRVRLQPLRYQSSLVPTGLEQELAEGGALPYRFANRHPRTGEYLDLSRDADERWLNYYGLPPLRTPQDLADWLELPLGKVAWLTNRFAVNYRPQSMKEAHYHYHWIRKRTGGHRLIESPKPVLKQVQGKLLREILAQVPAHPQVHGFVSGRSLLTNARPHVGNRVVLKLDLRNFYTSVRYTRVVAIFRSFGYSRDVALWLARLTTSAIPSNLKVPLGESNLLWQYLARHLPQGAPTSPALANLSAYALDVRLSGLARRYHANYTRYADDLTFSGDARFVPALREFIPLVKQIVRHERFFLQQKKTKVLRSSQRQLVTGVVVNESPNVSRKEYDLLKAILHNCVRHGPSTQNHDRHDDFAAHLQGRIAHVRYLNPARGEKLRRLFQQIDWSK